MPNGPIQTVFVILVGAVAPAGLARAAVRNGWPIHRALPRRTSLDLSSGAGRPAVVIVHLPVADDPALELIQSLRDSRRCSIIIALGAAANEDAEIRARAAGAGLYLPDTADADLVERTVRALALQSDRVPSTPRPSLV
jgi:ActR/RegA family two-component response regulator